MSRWPDKRPKLDRDAARRQGEITTLAMKTLGRDEAIAFMNTDNTEMGGRPIDLAVESEEGRARVETALTARK